MEGSSSPLPPQPPISSLHGGLTKSNSVASRSSAKSCRSIRHPFGRLRLVSHEGTDDGDMREDDQDSDASLPPLDPAGEEEPPQKIKKSRAAEQDATGAAAAAAAATITTTSGRRSSHSSMISFKHGLGVGDVVLILDLPDVFTVGYDSVTLTARDFLGFKEIPNGAHFFWVAQPGGVSTRSGCWIVTNGENRIHILQWDKYNEVMVEPTRTKARLQSAVIEQVYSVLMPYSNPLAERPADSETPTADAFAERLQVWNQLSASVTEDMLVRICGWSEWRAYFVHTTDMARGAVLPREEQLLNKRLSVSAVYLQSREVKFTFPQDEQTYTTRHMGRDRTLEATDSSSYIHAVLERQNKPLDMVHFGGELQFAYVSGMHLGNDACIQQWWYMLVKLVLKAYLLPECHPGLASALLRTLAAQLSYSFERLEGSFLEYIGDAKKRDLRLALTVYKRRLDELVDTLKSDATPEHLAVANAFAKIEAVVAAHLDWDLQGSYVRKGRAVMEDGEEVELELEDLEGEDERGEYAPTFVSLNEHGRPDDLISWSS